MVRSNPFATIRTLRSLPLQPAVAPLAFAARSRTLPALTAQRFLSQSSRSQLATPVTHPAPPSAPRDLKSAPKNAALFPRDVSGTDAQSPGSRHPGETEPGSAAAVQATDAYPDYSKGQSAIEKAAHLFFFTEIIRGMFIVLEQFFRKFTRRFLLASRLTCPRLCNMGCSVCVADRRMSCLTRVCEVVEGFVGWAAKD